MGKRPSEGSGNKSKRIRQTTHLSSQVIDVRLPHNLPPTSQPEQVRYPHVLSSVNSSGDRSTSTTYVEASKTSRRRVIPPEEYAAVSFSSDLFGGVTEPPVHEPQYAALSAVVSEAFAAEFPTEARANEEVDEHGDKSKKKRIRDPEDAPLLYWKENSRQRYLNEILRLEGRGSFLSCTICTACRKSNTDHFRCQDCQSHGRVLCASCIVSTHEAMPFHRIERWTGSFFEKSSLKTLGLRIQLGHPHGERCLVPQLPYDDDFVVIDVNGVHEVGLQFCGCQTGGPKEHDIQLLRASLYPSTGINPRTAATFSVLKQFHLLSFESKISADAFVASVERLTNNEDQGKSRVRYKEFMRMVRQWRSLKQLKRAGRGNDPSGVAGTQRGECALLCPACPHPDINLPKNWELVGKDKEWLYGLFLGIDGNFRLKRKRISSDDQDPGLSDGWAFLVEEKDFKAFLAAHWDYRQERSTCVNHSAVNDYDKEARGLAASGAATVDCIRHDFKRPNGVGDFQKGERYINTDYVFFSSLFGCKVRLIRVSYDISCQWGKNIDVRVSLLPEHLQWPLSVKKMTLFVPKFHIGAHDLVCNLELSFNITPGVGRTDGEAPERGWANINPLANSTKEMGPGARRDTLDDHFNDWNWKKIVKLPDLQIDKLRKAIPEARKQREILADFEEARPSVIPVWTREVEAWEADRKNPNPYAPKVKVVTEREVRLQLAREAAATVDAERIDQHSEASASAREIHPSVMISMGLDIEQAQRALAADASPLTESRATAHQMTKVIDDSNRLRRRIAAWTDIQSVHMPEAVVHREKLVVDEVDGIAGVSAHHIPLCLPSSLPSRSARPLRLYEWKLRHGQAHDALGDIRHHLRLRSALFYHKDRYARGVEQNTRSVTAIKTCQGNIDRAVAKYQAAWRAMEALHEGLVSSIPQDWNRYIQPLRREDIRGLADGLLGETEGNRTISWIWRSEGGEMSTISTATTFEDDPGLNEALKIEWCKLRARSMRWEEEVELLQEEMRRTEVFFKWKSKWWMGRGADIETDAETKDGLLAYAASQSCMWQSLRERCWLSWKNVHILLSPAPVVDTRTVVSSEK